jgi:hypothetical protein
MNGIDFIADTNILVFLLSGNENIKQYEGSHFECLNLYPE